MATKKPITISDLYPDLTVEEQNEAEANLRKYLHVIIRMAERFHAEGRSLNDMADLTLSAEEFIVQDERSNSSNQ